ncbi:FAD-dependent oxidoreductase [Rhodococcus sp. ABRD24]|uniref:NAD(P)/FAD-dependent oxidoreductase n=1 Tax=Rhodococcus sp. ABRD24 TaxID=2507582 RepID=UPI00103C474C|nr:FAD-dependent oxidoreductase [Rhodococcus sp. ABRD24]QBJ97194.1 FAD-dependent oxidoreductase [Rhodococcus sp. ABRD24]
MPTGEAVVVIGASVAGASFVTEARALGHRGPIVVIDADPDAPYDRPPLSKEFLTSDDQQPAAPWWNGDCRLVNGRALGLDAEAGRVQVKMADGSVQGISGARIVIATGSTPVRLPDEPESVLRLRTADDARRLRASARADASVIIIGAGTVGTELASSLTDAGCRVSVVDRADHPLERLLGGHLGSETTQWLTGAGVEVHFGTSINRINRDGGGWSVQLDDALLRSDILISAVGTRPCTGWLENSGLDISDGIMCDGDGRALGSDGDPVAAVYAIGDVASWQDGNGKHRRREDWTSAQRQGSHVAKQLFGDAPPPDRELPYFWTRQFGRRIQILGTPDRDARLVQHVDIPERRAAFYTIESDGRPTAWVAVNTPREFARAMQDAIQLVV